MRFVLIATILLLIPPASFSQNEADEKDSVEEHFEVIQLEKSLDELKEKIKSVNDSLNREIENYESKEDYYSVALEDQSNRFALIVTGLLAILALVSYSGYKIEIHRLRKNVAKLLHEQKTEFEDYKKRILKLDSGLSTSAANTFSTVADNYFREESWLLSLEFSLCAARDHANSAMLDIELGNDSKEDKDRYEFVVGNLESAVDAQNRIKSNDKLKDAVSNRLDFLIEQLNSLSDVQYEEVQDLVAELRIGLKNYAK